MNHFAAILTCLALAGCGAAPAQSTKAIDPGGEITLAPGETVSVNTAEMDVRFMGVIGDSRCPHDVTCIWAGEVKAQLEIQIAEVDSQVDVLEGGSTVAGAFRVTLVRVEPQPMSNAKIAPQDYRATLKIDKAG